MAMTRSLWRLAALTGILVVLVALPFACTERATSPPPSVAARPPAEPIDTTTPREIELSDAKMSFRDAEVVMFEVKSRFTKGDPQPGYVYQLEVAFPGTTNRGIKPLIGQEVKKQGLL